MESEFDDLLHCLKNKTPLNHVTDVTIKELLSSVFNLMESGDESWKQFFSNEYPINLGECILIRGSPAKGKGHGITFGGKQNFSKNIRNGICWNTSSVIPSKPVTEYRLEIHKNEIAKDNPNFPRFLHVNRSEKGNTKPDKLENNPVSFSINEEEDEIDRLLEVERKTVLEDFVAHRAETEHHPGYSSFEYVYGEKIVYKNMFHVSDEREKENIKDYEGNALETIENLPSKSYSYKSDPNKNEEIGYLAQDVQRANASLVVEHQGTLAINQNSLVAVQGEAIKQVNKKVEQVKEVIKNKDWKVYHKECGKELFDLEHIFIFRTPASPNGDKSAITEHVCARVEQIEGSQFIEIIPKKERIKNPFKATGNIFCKKCGAEDGKIGGVSIGLAARYTNSKTAQLKQKEIFFKSKETKISGKEFAKLKEMKLVEILEENEEDRKYAEELKKKLEGRPSRISITVRQMTSETGHLFVCDMDDETFEKLLLRIKEKIPEFKEMDSLLTEDGDMYSSSDFVLNTLNEGAKIIIANQREDNEFIELRKYQRELLDQSVDRNSIVVIPTGTGKTAVAVEVYRKLARGKQNYKACMLVTTKILAIQQAYEFERNTKKVRVTKITGEHKEAWEDVMETKDIVVCTAQTLLNALMKREVFLSQFNLLIFDEAHHCLKDHPFNRIMRDFYYKTEEEKRPRILGLTASPAGEKTVEATEDKIHRLEKALNSTICLVRENRKELDEFTSRPSTIQQDLDLPKEQLQFENKIVDYMKRAEKKLEINKGKIDRGTPDYEKYLYSILSSGISVLEKSEIRALLKLNEMLENFLDVGYSNTMKLSEDPVDILDQIGVTPDEREALDKLSAELTPKQKKLLENLRKLESSLPNVTVMVFVTTKKGAEVILNLIQSNIPAFKAQLLVGHGSANGVGMSSDKQREVLAGFNSKKYNLLVSTSVGEEGLNIASCNTVIYYGNLTSGRALIQARGRSRDKNGTFYIMYYRNTLAEMHYQKSVIKEKNMNLVLEERAKKESKK